jgi:peptidoglycan/LPS O-acetylase OafA/YrhL
VLLVVFFHYFSNAEFPSAIRLSASLGWTGVDLFFVMSGFLIGGIILDSKESSNFFSVFYLRRALRIVPLYYILLAAGTGGILLGFDLGTIRRMLVQFAFLQNFAIATGGDLGPSWLGPTWSLAVEEHFYLSLPLLVVLVPRQNLRLVLVLLIIASLLLRIAVFSIGFQNPWAIAYFATPCRMDELLVGVLAAEFIRRPHSRDTLDGNALVLCFAMLVCASIFIGIIFYERPTRSVVLTNTIGLWAVSGFYLTVLLLSISRKGGPISRSARLGALRWFGIRAYAIYLFHLPAMELVAFLSRSADVSLPILADRSLAFAMTCALAAMSWMLIESPLIEFSHRFRYNQTDGRASDAVLAQPMNT